MFKLLRWRKTGSSGQMVCALGRQGDFDPQQLPDNTTAFAIVREPLERYMSGYATIRARVGNRPPFDTANHTEVDHFRWFVQLQTSRGEGMLSELPAIARYPHVWYHTFSQMFFLEAYPREVRHILHMESIDADFRELKRSVDLGCCANGLPHQNADEGGLQVDRAQLKEKAPDAIAMLLRYLRQDYVCLGYQLPLSLRRSTGRASARPVEDV